MKMSGADECYAARHIISDSNERIFAVMLLKKKLKAKQKEAKLINN